MAYAQHKVVECLAYLLAGNTIRATAEKHGVSHTTVEKWAKKLPENATPKDSIEKLVQDISGALWELQAERIRAQHKIAKLLDDDEWLKRQDAGNIARLAEVLDDKTTRALGLLAGGTPTDAVSAGSQEATQ